MKIQKRSTYPANLLFFDTETKSMLEEKNPIVDYQELWFGFAEYLRLEDGEISRRKLQRFETVSQFWEIVRSRLDHKRPLYCFAHNLGFDLTICDFWQQSVKLDIDIDFAVIEDPPVIFAAKFDGCRVYFVDTLNYWRTSLAKLGDSLGYKKKEMPSRSASKEEWDEYCAQDVKILTESVCGLMTFLRENALGSFGFSSPSIAVSSYKKCFNHHKIHIHDRDELCRLERQAYYGGLVHNFFIGKVKEKVYHVDVNSLYPAMMLKEYPVKLIAERSNPPIAMIGTLAENFALVANVDMYSRDEMFPKKVDKKLCMVTGEFNTTLCGPELIRAYKSKSIEKVNHIAWYTKAKIFVDYVNFFWTKRKFFKTIQKNPVYDEFCKLMMNSLYGKFGQRGVVWCDYSIDLLREYYKKLLIPFPSEYETNGFTPRINFGSKRIFLLDMDQPTTFRCINNNIQMQFPVEEHFESFPLIAAYVTSYGREFLWSLVKKSGERNCFYCDTDSLFVNTKGYNNLVKGGYVDPLELGKLKLEGCTKSAIFNCAKDYELLSYVSEKDKSSKIDIRRRKGVKEKAVYLGNNTFEQLQFEGIKSVLKRAEETEDGTRLPPKPFIEIKKVTKVLTRRYSKGNVDEDGWTLPFVMEKNEVLELF